MKSVFAVIAGTNGAHETDDVMSLWSTEALALVECERLKALAAVHSSVLITSYGGQFSVVEFYIDEVSNQPIN